MSLTAKQAQIMRWFIDASRRQCPDLDDPAQMPWFEGRDVFEALGGGKSKASTEAALRDLAHAGYLQMGHPSSTAPYAEHPYRLRTVHENLVELAVLAQATRDLEAMS